MSVIVGISMAKYPQPAIYTTRQSGNSIQIDRRAAPRKGDWVAVQHGNKCLVERFREQPGIVGVIRLLARLLF